MSCQVVERNGVASSTPLSLSVESKQGWSSLTVQHEGKKSLVDAQGHKTSLQISGYVENYL